MRVLYVEDEQHLAEAVTHILGKAQIVADLAKDGETAVQLAKRNEYDCIILDIMLPKMSGWDVLKILRQSKIQSPIIMLSALSEVNDKVKALDIGADDYLAKPFKTAELIARLKALVRRPPLQKDQIIKFGDLIYDKSVRSLNDLSLTAKEAQILEMLLGAPQRIVSKEQILFRVWGDSIDYTDSYVEVYVSYLRKKLRTLKSKVKIVAIRNLGYKICMDKKNKCSKSCIDKLF